MNDGIEWVPTSKEAYYRWLALIPEDQVEYMHPIVQKTWQQIMGRMVAYDPTKREPE